MGGGTKLNLFLTVLVLLGLATVIAGQTCDLKCNGTYAPLCASNLHTYGNTCGLQVDKCLRSLGDLVILHNGPCRTCSTDQGSCRCPADQSIAQYRCPTTVRLVCGTDRVTYDNECLLNLANLCTPEYVIDISSPGRCPDITCTGGCPPVDDPVCGSDRRNYSSNCFLQLAKKCTPGLEDLVKLHGGKCDCSSDSVCPTTRAPVCATHGITYTNKCRLDVEKLCTGRSINVVHKGVCRCGTDYGCPKDWSPVCGTNGVTYNNTCHLHQVKLCAPEVAVAHAGRCGCNVTCSPKLTDRPVCGSDLKTYRSMCQLNVTRCTRPEVKFAYNGSCAPGQCGDKFGNPQDGFVVYTHIDARRRGAAFSCSQGFRLEGQATFFCTDGVWVPAQAPQCVRIDGTTCPRNINLQNGMVRYVQLSGGVRAYFTCNRNYQIAEEAPAFMDCQYKDGAWHGLPHCELDCYTTCGTKNNTAVCGSDLKTYPSLCHLNNINCNSSLTLTALHVGECTCGRNYPCTKELTPLCGTNAVTYSNRCLFKLAKLCIPELKVAKMGPCQCNDVCPEYYAPVCASNFQTYGNLCFFNAANCHRGLSLRVIYQGECICDKNYTCSLKFRPVCGTDGVTYTNECLLNVANLCTPGTMIKVQSQGACPLGCNATCDAKKNNTTVCASDFKTYPSICHLNTMNCKSGLTLTALHVGECTCGRKYPCTKELNPLCGTNGVTYNNRCLFKLAKLCIPGLNVTNTGPCRCNDVCPMNYAPVCASNFMTYGNLCFFNAANCHRGLSLRVIYQGECKCDKNYPCPLELQPVCGTDGVTYDNECLLKMANLCTPGTIIEVDSQSRCPLGCKRACPKTDSPVCGSDYNTYGNICFLEAAKCRSKDPLELLYSGRCRCPQGPFCTNLYKPVCSNLGIFFKNECFLNVYRLCTDPTVVQRFAVFCYLPPPQERRRQGRNSAAGFKAPQWVWFVMMSLATWKMFI